MFCIVFDVLWYLKFYPLNYKHKFDDTVQMSWGLPSRASLFYIFGLKHFVTYLITYKRLDDHTTFRHDVFCERECFYKLTPVCWGCSGPAALWINPQVICRSGWRAGMPGGRCEASWALLRCCNPLWRRGLAPGGQRLGGVGGSVVVGAGADVLPGFWILKWLCGLGVLHAGSSPCSSLFPAQNICSVFPV